MKRKKIVAANWKMNLTFDEAAEWLSEVSDEAENAACDVLVFPSFVLIGDLMELYEGEKIVFGAQNCSDKESGALTGEVSAGQLGSIGVEFVIIGHSERREHFGETNETVKNKLEQAMRNNLSPVFCCGEPLSVREQNNQKEYVKKQLEESMFHFSEYEIAEIIIAYEPIWAIGTGLNATPEQAQEMHAFIRAQIAERYSQKLANETFILYGGSCKPDNAASLFACEDVDGGLIGGASLKAKDFLAIVAATK